MLPPFVRDALAGAAAAARSRLRDRGRGLEWLRLAAAGVFDGLPGLQVILGHGGEPVLFYLERTAAVLDRALALDRSLADHARRNLYVTGSGMWSADYLRRCLAIVGPERLLFSTDSPYQHRPGGEPRRFLRDAPLDEAARAGPAHANRKRLTGCRTSRAPFRSGGGPR